MTKFDFQLNFRLAGWAFYFVLGVRDFQLDTKQNQKNQDWLMGLSVFYNVVVIATKRTNA